MAKEKTQWKLFIEAVSVLQWVLSFLFLGKIPTWSITAHSAILMLTVALLHQSVRCYIFALQHGGQCTFWRSSICFPSPGLACIFLMVYLMFTSLWPLSVLGFLWLVVDWNTPEKGRGRHILHCKTAALTLEGWKTGTVTVMLPQTQTKTYMYNNSAKLVWNAYLSKIVWNMFKMCKMFVRGQEECLCQELESMGPL